ncbi:isochorismatase [Thalassospira profundimaris]|uniref:Isochorismatase n=1 Tax=Thalassospira profundimaris TaxID=502049 RepID=A0A367X4S0_9PROT|nr:hydrolase [Thalassospira profundimaris]RCK48673.1 isochorismatase [Thalassospira profundimaris]
MLMDAARSTLVIVDVQEKLYPACLDPVDMIDACCFLLKCANRLSVPAIVTEQYPKGLGHTAKSILDLLEQESDGSNVVDKISFSCLGAEGFLAKLEENHGRDQVVVAGMETHVCVLQTVLDLIERGREVFVVADAVSSRKPHDRIFGLERMRDAGAKIVTRESVMFEWLRVAGTPEFKELSALIR